MSSVNSEEFELFGGKYKVTIGCRGRVKVLSTALNGKPLTIYGKKVNGVRFVNLTKDREEGSRSYNLDTIKSYCLGSCVGTLPYMLDSEVKEAMKREDLPPLISCSAVIETLPKQLDRYGNTVYIEELEHYTRAYTKVKWTKASNGYLKYSYNVAVRSSIDGVVTNERTEPFTDKDKIIINDINEVCRKELKQIITELTERVASD